MAASLKNTMSGTDVQAGDEALAGESLPPEAQALAALLQGISSAPTPEETAAGQAQAQAAFAPLMAQLQKQGEADQAPAQTSPFGSFLVNLASNIAGSVNPAFAKPGQEALENQRQEGIKFTGRAEERTSQGLKLAASMTEAALKAAQDAGDDRAATQKALALARLNDTLARRRQSEGIQERGKVQKDVANTNSQNRVRVTLQLRRDLDKKIDNLKLPADVALRLRAKKDFWTSWLSSETRVDPYTGEAPMDPNDAREQASQGFDDDLNAELAKIGKAPADSTETPKGNDLFKNVKNRLDKNKKK